MSSSPGSGLSDGRPENALGRLAGFAASLTFDAIPAEVVERAKLTLAHNLLVALAAGSEAIPGQDARRWPEGMPADACATRLTDGRPAPVESAIVTNALAMGARAQHDEHPETICHFGSTVLPPLLATAEIADVSGRRLLAAMVAAYEVGARVASMSGGETKLRGFRPTGMYGPFAGATATGCALGLGAEALVSALALAGNASAGLMQTWLAGTDEWRYQTAFAGRNGFVAARLAAEGARGALDTLEGASGFHRAFAGRAVDESAPLADLGQRWALETILLKPYPVCAFNQAPVQQILRLREAHGVDPRTVAAIRITLDGHDLAYPGIDTPQPVRTRPAALMCLRTCAAIALLENDVPIAALEQPDSEAVREIWKRVELVADPAIPSHTSVVSITTGDGTVLDSGRPQGVVYDRDVQAALIERLLPATGMDAARLRELLDLVDTLDERDGVGELLDIVRSR